MTELLEKAFTEASKLPERERRALASWILHEIDSEKNWAEAFATSEDTLGRLSDEALAEHREAGTRELDPDKL
jgi:hypothetical protein